jgi:hypothetical protein
VADDSIEPRMLLHWHFVGVGPELGNKVVLVHEGVLSYASNDVDKEYSSFKGVGVCVRPSQWVYDYICERAAVEILHRSASQDDGKEAVG